MHFSAKALTFINSGVCQNSVRLSFDSLGQAYPEPVSVCAGTGHSGNLI